MSKTIDDILDSLYAAGSTHGGNGVSYDKSDNPRLDEAKAELEALLLGEDAPEDFAGNNRRLGQDMFNQANAAWRQHIRNKLGVNNGG